MEPNSKLIKSPVTKNWRYKNRPLPEDQSTLQLLASRTMKQLGYE